MLEAQLLLEIGKDVKIILLFDRLEDAIVARTREDDLPVYKIRGKPSSKERRAEGYVEK